MEIFKIPRDSYRWLLAELLVIVLGILIAFQVEEFRESIRNHDREQSILIGMLEDYEFNKSLLVRYQESLNCRIGSIISYRDYLSNSPSRTTEGIVDINAGCEDFYWRPSYPSYQGWRDLGEPELISSNSIRRTFNDFHEGFTPFMVSYTGEYRIISNSLRQARYSDFEFNVTKSLDKENSFERATGLIYPLSEIPRHLEFYERVSDFLIIALGMTSRTQEGVDRIEFLESEIQKHLNFMQE
ncbi:MAG: hypothetical protein COA96_14220 [SAR86 cluster bacterium]|uniref:Uncharacterized protein n=1 Tax=SAR86 cluster bacterium TaxID=2030880 RepID=A0A2A5ATP7_9GAMM|nr:MAG: hypothetical protein COA96_14220 [SAR86 cluster bacterium]